MYRKVQLITIVLLVQVLLQSASFSHKVTAQTDDSQSQQNCAIALNIFFVGETCLVAGATLRYGQYNARWAIKDNTANLVRVNLTESLFPISIASKPLKFSWIEIEPYIDFSLLDRIDNKVNGSYTPDDSDFVSVYWLTTDEQKADIAILSDNALLGDLHAAIEFQYADLGILARTPWSFFKTGLGLGLGYHDASFEFYYCVRNCDSRFAFFNGKSTYFGPMGVFAFSLYEDDELTILRYTYQLKQDSIVEIDGGGSYYAYTEVENLTYIAWNFFF